MKILIIRLSSIGDIVLTTPVVRCLAKQLKDVELHYVCKPMYADLLKNNPYINHVHVFDKKDKKSLKKLINNQFDYIIDLQRNFYSRKISRKLGATRTSFPKMNLKKWILVNFKINLMPDIHVVERYFEEVKHLNVSSDGEGLDYFISDAEKQEFSTLDLPSNYVAVALGSKHKTKQIPQDKLLSICKEIHLPLVLLGDHNDKTIAEFLQANLKEKVYNLCGKLSLTLSAACVQHAECILTGDTGLMHIASAFQQKIVSVWGNTVPAFGMYPYMPKHREKYVIIENKELYCRPCSKLGHKQCPLGHFKCMNDVSTEEIVKHIN